MHNKLSSEGIKLTEVSSEGTLSELPGLDVSCTELTKPDKEATHVNADINALGLYKSTYSGLGINITIFGIDLSKTTNSKIEGTVKMIKWDKKKKTMKLEQSRKYYYWKKV